jgi:DNA polymerase I-like protein with 3'-5' exonuclease and polymerase domains/intein/homing endonuclease
VQKDYSLVPISILGPYACEDVLATAHLYERMRAKFKNLKHSTENQGLPTHTQLELLRFDQELIRVLFEMQWTGARMDLLAILQAKREALDRLAWAHDVMVAASGEKEFNPASAKELAAAFKRAGGEVKRWMLEKAARGKQKAAQFTLDENAGTGRPCWNAAALYGYLEELKGRQDDRAYRFLNAYRAHSQLQRLISTYLDAYLRSADPQGILHGSFLPTGTRTGRLSSRSPNLHNVTKTEDNADAKALEDVIDQDLLPGSGWLSGYRELPCYGSNSALSVEAVQPDLSNRIRSFFVARPGRAIVSIDYSSIEYRVAAWTTGDAALIKAFKDNPALDFHQHCADLVKINRSEAKTCVAGDSLVKTGRGLLRIDELVGSAPGRRELCNQSVYCEDGKVRNAVSGISMGKKEVLELTTEWGVKLKLTPDHECMAVRDGQLVRVRADSLKRGDNVIMQHGAECHGNNRELPSLSQEARRVHTSHKALRISELTPEFCAWLGHFVAEGHRRSDRTNKYSVGSAINPKQDADVCSYLKDLHVHLFKDRARVHTYAGVVYFRISSKDLYCLLEEMGVGHNSASQAIPKCIRSAPFEFKRAFLRAYFEGDGTVSRGGVSCTSKSEELIRQIQAEMLNIGIVGAVRSESRKDYGLFWSWQVKNREMLRRFEERIGFIGERKRGKLSVILSSLAQSKRSCLFYDGFEKWYPGMSVRLHGLARDKITECGTANVRLGDTRVQLIPAELLPASLTQLMQAGMSTVKVLCVKKCRKKERVYDVYEPVKTSMVCNGLLVADCNFGLLYGLGDAALAGMLKISRSQAESIRARLYSNIPSMRQLINRFKALGGTAHRVQNPFGRVCRVPEDRAYVALNYYVQGFCGDIMRRALVKVYRLIYAKRWDILMLLTIHDEIVFDMPPDLVKFAVPLIVAEMTNFPEVGLPLVCDVEVGRSWGNMVKFADWTERN